uniref:Ribosomal RNA small subunit methyltransferase G n=2 Tax=Anthurium amnicola TaxID=1678845 RepID=A0A1D1YTY9_9ARAE
MNLTAVRDESEAMARHVEDSLAIIPPLRSHYVSRCRGEGGRVDSVCDHLNVVDVGTGPGLPGLILAIACPNWKLTLLESMQKRCRFLEHAIGLTGLCNVQVLCDRAESVGQKLDFREAFDVAVSRAVAEMRTLAEYCLPLVRVGGLFVAAKGYDPQVEIGSAQNAVRLLGASIIDLCSVESEGPHGRRTAVICYKEHATPRKYPRQPGVPTKMPL